MGANTQPGPGWTLVLRRQPAWIMGAGQKTATPAWLSSSAAPAVMIPTWITVRSHPGFGWFAGPTRSRPVLRRASSTSGCTSS